MEAPYIHVNSVPNMMKEVISSAKRRDMASTAAHFCCCPLCAIHTLIRNLFCPKDKELILLDRDRLRVILTDIKDMHAIDNQDPQAQTEIIRQQIETAIRIAKSIQFGSKSFNFAYGQVNERILRHLRTMMEIDQRFTSMIARLNGNDESTELPVTASPSPIFFSRTNNIPPSYDELIGQAELHNEGGILDNHPQSPSPNQFRDPNGLYIDE